MKVYVNEITGIADAITSMFMSKRTWNRDYEMEIRRVCESVLDRNGRIRNHSEFMNQDIDSFNSWMNNLVKWGWKHTTMLRFIDISITVEGLHRAGQDDWDAHAKRFNNRIIRSSTRLSDFKYEMSEWYENKILPTDIALQHLGLSIPDEIYVDGKKYVKKINGYIVDEYKDNPDVKRGLYMLSIPSNFIFKIDMTEWGHVYKERNNNSSANPEVKMCCEDIATQLESFHKQFNKELFMKIKN